MQVTTPHDASQKSRVSPSRSHAINALHSIVVNAQESRVMTPPSTPEGNGANQGHSCTQNTLCGQFHTIQEKLNTSRLQFQIVRTLQRCYHRRALPFPLPVWNWFLPLRAVICGRARAQAVRSMSNCCVRCEYRRVAHVLV